MNNKNKFINDSDTDIENSCKLIREKNILYFIREITKALVSTRSIEEMSKMVYTFLKNSYGDCTIGLAVNYPKEKKISDCFFFENNERLDFEEILYSEGSASKLLKAVLNKKEYIYEKQTRNSPSVFIGRIPSATFFAPLIIEKDVIGAFTFQIYERDLFSIEEIAVCQELIPFMTIALNNTLQNKQILMTNKILERHSKYDDLTGIYNRRFFYESFHNIYKSSISKNENSFLYLMDLNNFKGVNDNFGHFVGDQALIEVAEVLTKLFLKKGEVGRYGGDEFLCGITKISKEDAVELGEKIIKEIENLNIVYNNSGGKVSISIGILKLNSKKDLRDYFLKLDENLYIAKKSTTSKIFIS
ncbi:MAG: GGDEF domain-containing protein [Psychrilyobacter sp.]|uniref:GGDEF domain-containing protein n=1 Tax=Psychrilyobacter sp. TaxID=2586924 RepID=UPI003C76BBA2